MSVSVARVAPLLSLARCARGKVLQDLDGRVMQDLDGRVMRNGSSGSNLEGLHNRNLSTENRGMLGTTVLCVRKDNKVIIIGDGQVTLGSEIIKPNVRKVRRLGANVIGGFAGGTADSFTLFERLESKLEEHSGQLTRAAVELAKAWRTDKFLRRLDAVMVVSDAEISLTITGNGDVLEPYDGVIGIGSGGSYASAAARALIDLPDWDAEAIAKKAMRIAADCCIYTNHNFTIERIDGAQRSLEDVKQAAVLSASEPFPSSN